MNKLLLSILLLLLLPVFALSNDREIIKKTNAFLDSLKGPHEVEVSSRLGVVTLTGYVASEEDKAELQSQIVSLEDVDTIENNLTVKSSRASLSHGGTSCSLSPHGVSLQGISLGDGSVEAYCFGTTITLSGTLADAVQVSHVVNALQERYPTALIQNSLHVKQRIPDEILRTSILDSLRSDSLIPPTVFLSVKDGTAHFSGTVTNHRVIDQILARTIMIDGVKDALSKVTIE